MDPSKVIDSILNDWGNITAEDTPSQVGGETDPTIKPTVQPDNDPSREVNPVTPDNLPPGTPGTPGGPETPPADEVVPPGGPIWNEPETPETPDPNTPPATITLSNGQEVSLAEIESLIASRNTPPASPPSNPPTPTPDPNLYVPPQVTPPVIPPVAPILPAFSQDDLDNPAIQAVVMIAARQQEELATLKAQQEQYNQALAARQHQENNEIVNSAVSAFRNEYKLPEELMTEVSNQASLFLNSALDRQRAQGIFNPYEAVMDSLRNAYWTVPAARSFEFERQSSQRQSALDRQRKLNGVGGASGTPPRTPQAPEGSLYDRMVAEVAAAMDNE